MIISPNEYWQLRIGTYSPVQAGINVVNFYVYGTVVPDPTDLQLATKIDSVLAPLYKAVLSENAKYYGVSLQRIWPLPKTTPQVVYTNEGPGLTVGDLVPQQVSGILSMKTDLAGRKFRGRIYIPFPGEASNEVDATPTATYVSNVQAIGTALLGPAWVVAGGGEVRMYPVVWHRTLNNGTEVKTTLAKDKWATQRRRGNFGRVNAPPF